MLPTPERLSHYGAPLTSAFRSLSPSILGKNQKPGAPKVPKQPQLSDMNKEVFNTKELAALANYFRMGSF